MKLKKKLERYLPVNLLGPGPCLIKKEFTSLTEVEKYCSKGLNFKNYSVVSEDLNS